MKMPKDIEAKLIERLDKYYDEDACIKRAGIYAQGFKDASKLWAEREALYKKFIKEMGDALDKLMNVM